MDAARLLWTLIEPYHAVVYFGQQVRQAYEDVGLTGFWRGYFAGRAAPMGAVGAGVVTACFYGFHPDFVSRAIPDVWNRASTGQALAARLEGVDRTLADLGVASQGPACSEAASLLRGAMEGCSVAGRPMFAANADQDWPEEPHLALWQAATLLREHRGIGHITALLQAGVGPCEAHVLRIAVDGADPGTIRPHRGWSEDDWQAATRPSPLRRMARRAGESNRRRPAVARRRRDPDRRTSERTGPQPRCGHGPVGRTHEEPHLHVVVFGPDPLPERDGCSAPSVSVGPLNRRQPKQLTDSSQARGGLSHRIL